MDWHIFHLGLIGSIPREGLWGCFTDILWEATRRKAARNSVEALVLHHRLDTKKLAHELVPGITLLICFVFRIRTSRSQDTYSEHGLNSQGIIEEHVVSVDELYYSDLHC
jgi:hypothetical protein